MLKKLSFYFKCFVNRIFFPIVGMSIRENPISIRKTLVFNYLAFGWKGIYKVPIFIYGNTNIYRVGKINIHCKMNRGLVRIGRLNFKSQGDTRFFNSGTINIYGPVKIEGASIFENYGKVSFYGNNVISDGSMVLIRSEFQMGIHSRLGFHGFIMDSDDHFTIDINTRKVYRNSKPIIIGAYNWFGNSTIIKKGVVTPDYLIVASTNALLTKDYTNLPPYSVLGGMPAKVIKSGIRRVFNLHNESDIIKHFKNNPEAMSFDIDSRVDLDKYCAN